MRNILIITSLLFGIHMSNAQTIERQVIGSSGATISNGSTTVDFTVGEVVTTTITDGTTTLSQGFLQGTIKLAININPKVFLQGAALNPYTGEESFMRDDLHRNSHIPTTSPYGDGNTLDSDIFNIQDTNALVDWIWVELRNATDNTQVIASQSALLQRDGDILDSQYNTLEFEVAAGNYYVVIKHRNHLGIMTTNTVALSKTGTTVDFTDASNQITFGNNAQTTFGMPSGKVAMWAGNVNADTIIQYSGTSPDTPEILSTVLNDAGNFLNFPTYAVSGYNSNDINLDGTTQYSGISPDVPFILQNILAHPGNFLNFSTYQITEQLPENP
ncbi:hemagglutinin protein [uncultured Kordia sp.]|uniref:hemagglutinin protein n=1 Tax=uncultured Kordia sp. TaxID=507699 RepID=UPI00260ECB22|nr:hemagglutinin protein [uncultured Kordia sp.]